ncbi:MAG: hypothetical protein M3T56_14890 [Chloroflexota bacterium]|nr:hypothetical protein [Chloroflexota bacterium]
MHRQSIACAAFAVLSLALFGDLRANVAQAYKTDMIESASRAVTVARGQDRLEVAIAQNAPIEVEPAVVLPAPVIETSTAVAETPTEPGQVAETSSEETPVAPVVVAPARPAPVARVAAPPPPATCPANYFCYPRVGIYGPIVPYNDCSGSTDVGTAIRSLSCLSSRYLAAHAYTQFGRLTGWRAGDVVTANGVRYVLYDGFTQRSCEYPARPLAPLSLQTSLTSLNCGMVLVVQARPE